MICLSVFWRTFLLPAANANCCLATWFQCASAKVELTQHYKVEEILHKRIFSWDANLECKYCSHKRICSWDAHLECKYCSHKRIQDAHLESKYCSHKRIHLCVQSVYAESPLTVYFVNLIFGNFAWNVDVKSFFCIFGASWMAWGRVEWAGAKLNGIGTWERHIWHPWTLGFSKI